MRCVPLFIERGVYKPRKSKKHFTVWPHNKLNLGSFYWWICEVTIFAASTRLVIWYGMIFCDNLWNWGRANCGSLGDHREMNLHSYQLQSLSEKKQLREWHDLSLWLYMLPYVTIFYHILPYFTNFYQHYPFPSLWLGVVSKFRSPFHVPSYFADFFFESRGGQQRAMRRGPGDDQTEGKIWPKIDGFCYEKELSCHSLPGYDLLISQLKYV